MIYWIWNCIFYTWLKLIFWKVELFLTNYFFETVNVSPNPSKGAFSIEQKSITESSLHVSIFNELGQVVLEKTLSEKATEFEVPNPGVYMLQITSDGKYSRRKIIRL